ncbi:hypothetical protein COF68_25265 [Bacillus toyonensis]|nr:hypothetical protein DPQ31_15470 [Bacillus sp. COPE52]PEA33755.1 hypothetical protein COO13_08250 [Bacillus toyonensis]PEA63147.1 hypothetical protein COO18_30305 [Bacillus toyonensis]PEA71142.1 hypothetical protein COO00_18535 [Bacillus toyonensis]PEC40366.1 hypothetical protein CON60_06165 [Bacillus toyonensis]
MSIIQGPFILYKSLIICVFLITDKIYRIMYVKKILIELKEYFIILNYIFVSKNGIKVPKFGTKRR